MTSGQEILNKKIEKLNTLKLMETSVVEVWDRRQTSHMKKNITLLEKHLDELKELKGIV